MPAVSQAIERRAIEGLSILARRDEGPVVSKSLIIGVTVGGCVAAFLMLLATFFLPEWWLRRRERKKEAEEAAAAAKVDGGVVAY